MSVQSIYKGKEGIISMQVSETELDLAGVNGMFSLMAAV